MNSLYMPTGYDEILGLFSAEMRPILPDQTNKINIVVLNSERILSLSIQLIAGAEVQVWMSLW